MIYILELDGHSTDITLSLKEKPLLGEVNQKEPCIKKISTSSIVVDNKPDARYRLFLAKILILDYISKEIGRGKEGYIEKEISKLY